MSESIQARAGKPLHEVGLSSGGVRTVILDRDVTLYRGGNYSIRGVSETEVDQHEI